MDVLATLGAALGLAALAGLNLYLTVFAASLAIHFGWVALPASLQHLSVLGNPWIMTVAGILYFLEFFADKIPWVDTANDAIHSIIRPLGGALLAVLALGDADPAIKVLAALLGGSVALTSHAAKAGTRLLANASPEPISNIGLSLGEDAVVLGGLTLLALHPVVATIVILVLIGVIWALFPPLLRIIKATMWLAWRKLNEPPVGREDEEIHHKLPDACELLLRRAHATRENIALATPCLSAGGPRLPRNFFGWLARFEGGRLFFVSPRWLTSIVIEIPLGSAEGNVRRESRFLTEKLILSSENGGSYQFVFDRGHRVLADRLADELRAPVLTPVAEPV